MSIVLRIAKNISALYLSRFIALALVFVLTVYMTRVLGDSGYGEYAYISSITAICLILINLGFDTLLVRVVSRDKSQSALYVGNTLIMKAVLSLVIFGAVEIIAILVNLPFEIHVALLVLTGYVSLEAFNTVFLRLFHAFERMEYDTLVTVTGQLIIVLFGFLALHYGYGLIGVVSAFAIGGFFKLLISIVISIWKFVKPKFRIDIGFCKDIFKKGLPISVLPIAGIICIRTDVIMLSTMKGDAAAGIYMAANNIPLLLNEVPWLFMSALLPLMSSSFISSPDTLSSAFKKSMKYLYIVGLPIAVGIFMLADRIVLTLYKAEFAAAADPLRILCWRNLLAFLGQPLSVTLLSMNKEKQVALIVVASAVLNIILNLLLIPPLRLTGAAITTLISGGLSLALYVKVVRGNLTFLSFKEYVKPVISCLFMAALIYWGDDVNLFLLIFLSVLVYFAILWIIRGIPKDDINDVITYFRTRRSGKVN